MRGDRWTPGQVGALLFAALLSPMPPVLPGTVTASAGAAGWLTALWALPAALALGWSVGILAREGGGMAAGLERAFGRGAGGLLSGIYFLWGAVLLGRNARWCAQRFLSINHRNAPLHLFLLLLLGLIFWTARKETCVLVRAGAMFALALAITLGGTLLLGMGQMERQNLGPLSVEELKAVLWGTGPVLGLLGYGAYGGFLIRGGLTERERRRLPVWGGVFCVVAALFQLVCIGSFGPELTARMERPFFMVVRGIGIRGAFQRVESLVLAQWVLADLALLGLLCFACRDLAQRKWGRERRGAALWAIAVVCMITAYIGGPDLRMAAVGNQILGVAIPVAGAITLCIRERRRKSKKPENSC